MANSPVLLSIETSTELCSVAISQGTEVIKESVVNQPKAHAKILAPMIDEILKISGIPLEECDAVVVSSGPGSYTGLRVGVSTAKGLCYGAKKPLISVGSLDILANLAVIEHNKNTDLIPRNIIAMIDARRMEVYSAIYSADGERLSAVEAVIIDEKSYHDTLESGLTLFCGDGALKVMDVIKHPNAQYMGINASAGGMVAPALIKFEEREFEDVAYFQPFYLKEFVAGISKKSII